MNTRERVLRVHGCGPQVLVQDAGRPGYAHLGVGRSGAADQDSYALANRLVGNTAGSAVLEIVMGGLEFETNHTTWIAVTGAPLLVRVGGRAAWINQPVLVRAGQQVALGSPHSGLRSYLALRGGINVAPVLGSRSTDTMSGIGSEPVSPGHVLPIGLPSGPMPGVDFAPRSKLDQDTVTLTAIPGPRADWFDSAALSQLYSCPFTVTSDLDRVGARLSGPTLTRRHGGELASEGVVRGSLQAPPDGRLTIFLADHPVTGGYPVIAVLSSDAVGEAAQLRPGQAVRFARRTESQPSVGAT